MTTTFRVSNGVRYKITDGRVLNPIQGKDFSSKSSPKTYTALIWEDGDQSCNCKGWATHKNCTHVRDMYDRAMQGQYGAAVRDLVRQFDRQRAERAAERIHEIVQARQPPPTAVYHSFYPDRPSRVAPAQLPPTPKQPKRDDDMPPEPGRRRIKL